MLPLLPVLALAAGRAAAAPFTLAEALSESLRANPALQAARRDVEAAAGRAVSAGAVPNPEVGAELQKLPGGEWSPGAAAQHLTVDQGVELWGKRPLRKASADAQLAAARAHYKSLELDLSRRLKEAYWNLSLARERGDFAEENLKFQARFLEQIQGDFQAGQAKVADVARAKFEVARVTNDMLVAKKTRKAAEADLNTLLGRDLDRPPPEPEHLSEVRLELDERDLLGRALADRPERAALAALLAGARADAGLARRLLWAPDLKAGMQLERRERDDGNSWGARLALVFPLWYRYDGERAAASAQLASLEAQGRDLARSIALDVRKALLEVQLSTDQIKLFKQAIDQATEAARLAEQRYHEGDADLLVAIQARRDLVNTTLDLISELRDYRVNLAALEQAVGQDLGEAKK